MNLLQTLTNQKKRIGFHYYPDNLHYRDSDLKTWLPELRMLGAGWLVLKASQTRAIPETFLRGLLEAEIEPVIQFSDLPLGQQGICQGLEPLLHSYSRWGCKIIQFFEQPNEKSSWSKEDWNQRDLVERFLDRWTPLANLTIDSGMLPLMPPMQPGGAYWDTAFILGVLEGLARRRQKDIIEQIILGAYGWSFGHSLNWGSGGPRRWNNARPYHTPNNTQDQCGFRTYEWYQAIAEAVLGRIFPIFILQAGIDSRPSTNMLKEDFFLQQVNDCRNIAQLLTNQPSTDHLSPETMLEPVPSNVLGAAFYCLTTAPTHPDLAMAWYPAEGISTPVAQTLKNLQVSNKPETFYPVQSKSPHQDNQPFPQGKQTNQIAHKIIEHYLLLPSFEWGISEYHLEVIRPFIKKHQPTVGFSIEEAALARRVTVINDTQTFSEEILSKLHQSGCQVDWIDNNSGTELATILSQR